MGGRWAPIVKKRCKSTTDVDGLPTLPSSLKATSCNRLKLPKASSVDPISLLLGNELVLVGLGPAKCSPTRTPKKKTSRKIQKKKLVLKTSSERKLRSEVNDYDDFEASTSTWPILGLDPDPTPISFPILGLEPDETPVIPRRQLSPKAKRKTTTATLPLCASLGQ